MVRTQNISRPYIIAEAGVNHEGDLDLAKRLIDEAKEGGADAIKFQTYKAATLAAKKSPAYWDLKQEKTTSQYLLFSKYDKFWKNEFEIIAEYCNKADIEFMSTPFDDESAKFLNDLMKVFKVSSSDLNNKPFIEYICAFQKPILLSTGAAYLWEIEQAVSWIERLENSVAIMHCVLNYPTEDYNANLAVINTLRSKFPQNCIGYSDHTLPKDMKALEIAALLGAKIIEKHFTHDKNLTGNDHYHSMDKNDLKKYCSSLDTIITLLGNESCTVLPSEGLSRKNARRSLVSKRDIKKGQVISREDITYKRPAYGIDPRDTNDLIGRKANCKIKEDSILQWNMFELESDLI